MKEQLSINLASDISYVYGSVNGVEALFHLSAPNVWSAVVSRSNDGVYVVDITAYNNLGTQSTFQTILYTSNGWIKPKIDWTPDDYYNFEDLDKVENNTLYIVELLKKFGVELILDCFTARSLKRIEFADSLNRIESNIEQLAHRYKPSNWIPNKTDWTANTSFNYEDANRLEFNLNTLYQHYKGNLDMLPNCGAFICGEEVI